MRSAPTATMKCRRVPGRFVRTGKSSRKIFARWVATSLPGAGRTRSASSVITDDALRVLPAPGKLVATHRAKIFRELLPVRTNLPGTRRHFIVAVGADLITTEFGCCRCRFQAESALSYRHVRRKSSVNGKSGLRSSGGTLTGPGV